MNFADENNRLAVYETVKHRVAQHDPDYLELDRACFYWAYYGYLELKKHGARVMLQAGTCYWRRIREADEPNYPPTENTWFGYEWGDPLTKLRSLMSVVNGNLPEVHIWLAAGPKDEVVIIDFSTAYFPDACRKILKVDWPGDLPPQFLWAEATPEGMPANCRYRPSLQAIRCVDRYLVRLLMQGDLPRE